MRFPCIVAIAASVVLCIERGASAADGWWVVAGSHSTELTNRTSRALDAVEARATKCGFDVHLESSGSFTGLTPNLLVQAVGPYASKSAAAYAASRLRQCIPTAYVKRGTYRPD